MDDAVFLNLFQQAQPQGFFFTLEDSHGAWLEVSPALAQLLGYVESDFPKPLAELIADAHLLEVSLTLTQGLLAGRPGVKHSLPVRHRQGQRLWLEFSKCLVSYQGQPRILAIGCDVTTTMEEMTQLRHESQRLERLVEHSPEILYRFGVATGTKYISPAFETALGYPISMAQQNPMLWHDSIHPDDLPQVDAAIARFQDKVPYDLVYRIRDAMGEWHYFHDRNLIFENDHGEMVVEGIAIDITPQKKVERELEKRLAEIQRLELVKSNFLAIMNHELRTPLNGIIGLSNLLKQRCKETVDDLNMIEECGMSLLSVVESVMDSNKLLENRYQTLVSCSQLPMLLEKISSLFLPAALAKGIEFEIEDHCPGREVFCTDWLILEKVVSHLVSNAVKFTEQGKVVLRCRQDAASGDLLLEVIDPGPGLDEAALEEHFQMFAQGEETLTRQHRGVGLGLYLVKKLAKLIQAQITYQRLQPGSHFTLRLPPLQAESPQPELDPSINAKKKISQVLVVDDDLANRMILKGILAPLVQVWVAESGEQALEILQEQPIDLVFLDFMMPRMDGFEVATQIRILEIEGILSHYTIVVGVSAFYDADTKQKALEAGMDAVIAKPFKYEMIQEIITSPASLAQYG